MDWDRSAGIPQHDKGKLACMDGLRLTKREKEVLRTMVEMHDVRIHGTMDELLVTLGQLREKGLVDFVELDQRDVGFAGQPWLTDKGKAFLRENPKLRNGLGEDAKWIIGIAVSVLVTLIAMF